MWNHVTKCLLLLTVIGAMILSSGCTIDISGVNIPDTLVIDYWGGGWDHCDHDDCD